jgi:hypothetical protein
MPTDHRRHAITETEDISEALGVARREWPSLADKPGALLRRLVLTGRDTLAHRDSRQHEDRRQVITDTSGALTGVFGPQFLDELREDWPE